MALKEQLILLLIRKFCIGFTILFAFRLFVFIDPGPLAPPISNKRDKKFLLESREEFNDI
jgi:hypothetical protein